MRALITYFVRYPIWSNAVIVIFCAAGWLAFDNIKKSFFPETPSRIVSIQVAYPGASPEEMEEGVVLKIEEALKGIVGVEQITSSSRENAAAVTVEGKQGYDPELLLTDVKNAVDRINGFPEAAEKPVVFKQRNLGRAITLVLTGDADLNVLKRMAESIEDDFLGSGEISQVTVSGFPAREISIELSEDQLLRYQLTFQQVANAVRINNTNITGGAIKAKDEEILIRADAKGYTPAEIEDIVVRNNPDGTMIRLKDVVSRIDEGFADSPEKTLYNGKNAVTINVRKLVEEDVIVVTDWVKDYVVEFNENDPKIQLEITNDQSESLKERLGLLVENGGVGLILVLVMLGFFLSLRLSFWVAWGIPFSFLGMFVVGFLVGITINMISLFGMILVIGILVDDGIVVGENIFAHMERGKSSVRAAIDGALEVLPSVFTSVATTIVIFCTFFFLKGRVGEIILEMAIVVIASLAFSLVECTLILPAHLAHTPQRTKEPGRFRSFFNGIIDFLREDVYGTTLQFVLRWRYLMLGFPILFIMITLGLFQGGVIQGTFFPFIESDESQINLVMKPGTREQIVESYLKDIETKVWELNAELMDSLSVDSLFLSTKMDIGSAGGESGGHTGSLEVSFTNGEGRPLRSDQLENMIRDKIGQIPEAEKLSIGGRRIFGKPVAISLIGNDLDALESANKMLKSELGNFSVLKDIQDNKQAGKREVRIKLRPRAYALGLTHGDIARQVRQGFFGEEVQRLQKGSDEVRVWVRYPESGRMDLGQLDQMKIKTLTGQVYPFQEVASYTMERGIVSINHYNGAREIKVEADLADQSTAVSPLLTEIREEIVPKVLQANPGVRVEYLGQERENAKMNENASVIYLSAFGLMFLLISLTFRSLPQALLLIPLIILGILGAIWGHGIHGKPISILSSYGILALTGIVVNDAVVLMAKFNSLIKEGVPMKDAVYQAGLARFRAIMLTSLTTVAGLYPLILAQSRQAQFLIPMAISVVYGVLFGTIFILIFFPIIILILNDVRCIIKAFWTGDAVSREEVEPAMKELIRQNKYGFLAEELPESTTKTSWLGEDMSAKAIDKEGL